MSLASALNTVWRARIIERLSTSARKLRVFIGEAPPTGGEK
jgi:hypothetical protein